MDEKKSGYFLSLMVLLAGVCGAFFIGRNTERASNATTVSAVPAPNATPVVTDVDRKVTNKDVRYISVDNNWYVLYTGPGQLLPTALFTVPLPQNQAKTETKKEVSKKTVVADSFPFPDDKKELPKTEKKVEPPKTEKTEPKVETKSN